MSGGGGGQVVPPPPPVMPTTRMPLPGERSAPRWSGKEKKLAEFLRNFEVAAKQAKLTDEERRNQLGLYITKGHLQDLLESLPGFKDTWEKYKEDILRYFPKADPDRFVTMSSLERLVERTHKKSRFKKASDYAKYNREFMRRGNGLKDKSIPTDSELVRKYWQGFPARTRARIEGRLQTKLPDKLIADCTFEEWWSAVNHIMENLRKREATSSDEESSGSASSDNSSDQSDDSETEEPEEEARTKQKSKHKRKKKSSKRETKDVKVKEEPRNDFHQLLLKMNSTQEKAIDAVAAVSEKLVTLSKHSFLNISF